MTQGNIRWQPFKRAHLWKWILKFCMTIRNTSIGVAGILLISLFSTQALSLGVSCILCFWDGRTKKNSYIGKSGDLGEITWLPKRYRQAVMGCDCILLKTRTMKIKKVLKLNIPFRRYCPSVILREVKANHASRWNGTPNCNLLVV